MRGCLWLPLILILGQTIFMPVMEIVPTSGSLASAVMALFAAGLLTRGGVVGAASFILLLAVPVAVSSASAAETSGERHGRATTEHWRIEVGHPGSLRSRRA